jgi:F-type H+-transporting ATPase subunit delta
MVHILVTTVVEPTSAQLEKIKKETVKKYGKDVKIETRIDSSIVGGIQITIGSRQLDGSIKGKLAQLKQQLTHTS